AHRGGALLWPENSLHAFRQALALGCDFLELDVHLTSDGEVAVIHDATLDRTSEGAGAVVAAKATALRRLRLRGPDGGLTDERATVMAFNPDVLTRVRARLPRQRTTLLVDADHVAQAGARPEETIDWALAVGATDVGLEHTLANETVVRAARAADVLLSVWT